MQNTFFTREEFNERFHIEIASARDVFEARSKSGIEDYSFGLYDFIYISDEKEKLELLSSFLYDNYSYKKLEVKKWGDKWELTGDAEQFPVDKDNLIFWSLDLYCKGYEFDCILDGYGATSDPDLGSPIMNAELEDHYFNLGLEAYNKRNFGMAIINWSTAIKINPNDPNSWYSRAIAKENLFA